MPSCRVTIRIPGRGCAGGWLAMISDAAKLISMITLYSCIVSDVPMPLSFVGVLLAMLAFSSFAVSPVIVDVEVEREKVLARGPRCVSLSSRGRDLSASIFGGEIDVEGSSKLAATFPSYCPTITGGANRASIQ